MKRYSFHHITLFLLAVFLLSACLRDYDVARFQVESIKLLAATTATNDGMPAATNDTIQRNLFALQTDFSITSNLSEIDFDMNESGINFTNPIDSVIIWSDNPFCNIPPLTPLNNQFFVLKHYLSDAYRFDTGRSLNLAKQQSKTPYYEKVWFVCDKSPASGNYRFYIRYFFRDETSLTDSTQVTVLE